MRRSRALPYELHVDSRVDALNGALVLLFRNTGAAGAVFHVYDRLHLDRIPRRYTVEPGKSLEDAWIASEPAGYDLWIHGPNGFVREFKGAHAASDAANPEVTARYDAARSAIELSVANKGRAACKLSVRSLYDKQGSKAFAVPAGESMIQRWSVADSAGWYDLTVSAQGFERRFAGRLETGHHTTSDPATA